MTLYRALLALIVVAVWPAVAAAESSDPAPLAVDEVLESSERHFPRILQSLAARREAVGDALSAAGAFDLVFGADGFSRVSGFYDGTAVEGTAKQRVRPLGASLYAGYKLSDGDFPIYEDENYTNTGGAFKVGMLFSLMRDREIDRERFTETDARLKLRSAEIDVLFTKIGVQERALIAYWKSEGARSLIPEALPGETMEDSVTNGRTVSSGRCGRARGHRSS